MTSSAYSYMSVYDTHDFCRAGAAYHDLCTSFFKLSLAKDGCGLRQLQRSQAFTGNRTKKIYVTAVSGLP